MRILPVIFYFLLNVGLCAQNIPEKPSPARFVNDFGHLLSSSESGSLEQKLINYHDTTSNQIAIVAIESLEGYDLESYSYELAKTWGIGQKDKKNGVLVLVAKAERKVRIEVGYGLEGAIPDAVCEQIIREVVKPYFKQNNYYEGLNQATDFLIKYASGEYKADEKVKGGSSTVIIIVIIVIIIIIISFVSKYRQVKQSHLGKSLDFWTILTLINALGDSRRNNRGGGFGGGSWGGGSSSGGSSWDFGGGSFGGGGASGDW